MSPFMIQTQGRASMRLSDRAGIGTMKKAQPFAARRRMRKPMSEIPAVIMAGGYGTRLKELTRDLPKPMVPVAGRPAVEYVVDHLQCHGIERAAFALHYLPEKILSHFESNWRPSIRLDYFIAPQDLGTAGGALKASQMVDGNPVIIASGDVLTDIDLTSLMEFHYSRNSLFTMALTQVEDASQYGVAISDDRGRINCFVEKPQNPPRGGAWVNAGIYVIDRLALSLIPQDQPFDISRNLIPLLMNHEFAIHGFKHDGYWIDIGTPQTLRHADEKFRNYRAPEAEGEMIAAAS